MSNTLARSSSSSAVSRSNSSVPSPASFSTPATYRLRGLCRLLPLPWAKTTMPRGALRHGQVPGEPHGPPRGARRPRRGPADPQPAAGPPPAAPDGRAGSRQASDLLVGGLGEVGVALADGEEPRRGLDADHLVGVRADPVRHSGGATGTASTTRAAPCARATWQAARAVDPVAMPSSTTTTTRPASGTPVARPGTRGPALHSARSRASTAGQFLLR